MEVLMVNGSSHPAGATYRALHIVEEDTLGERRLRQLGRNMARAVQAFAVAGNGE